MGERVQVDLAVGLGRGCVPTGDSMTIGSFRCGAALATAANLLENSPKHRCWLCEVDERERGGVPERRGAAVAEHHLVAVGQGEQLAQARAQPADDRLHRRLTVARPEVAVGDAGQGLHLGRPDLGRSRSEAPVGGQQFARDGDVGGASHVWNHGIS